MSRMIDMTGKRNGSWRVLFRNKDNKQSQTQWMCACECGKTKSIEGRRLREEAPLLCSCKAFNKMPEYGIYRGAKHRCNSPRHKFYSYYGGRGIQFKFSSFIEFMEEVGRRPSSLHTLDRIDNNSNYEKGNVRWATRKEQSANCRVRRDHGPVCKHGHVYTEKTTFVNAKGARECRVCIRIRRNNYKRRKNVGRTRNTVTA